MGILKKATFVLIALAALLACALPLSAANIGSWEDIAKEHGLEYKDGMLKGELNGMIVYARIYKDTSLFDNYPVSFTEVGVLPPEEKEFPVDVSLSNQGLLSGLVSGRDLDTKDKKFNRQFVLDVNPDEHIDAIFTPDVIEYCMELKSMQLHFNDEIGYFKVQDRIKDRDKIWAALNMMSIMGRNQMALVEDDTDPNEPKDVPRRRPRDDDDDKRGGGGGEGDVLE